MHAPGERGLVMVCFTLPSFDVVFKVIRDRFPVPEEHPARGGEGEVRLVFKHDRAGRLVDAQEFGACAFRRRASRRSCWRSWTERRAKTVHVEGEDLIFDHMYIERRMTPLNLYLRSAAPSRPSSPCSTTASASATSPTPTSSPATCC